MPSRQQDQSFAADISNCLDIRIEPSALDTAIEWIAHNLNPEDVFSKSDLEGWAEDNGYKKEDL